MSDPLPAAQQISDRSHRSHRSPVAEAARWLDWLTGALLLCAATSVVLSAVPSMLSALVPRHEVQSAARIPPRSYRAPPPSRRFGFDLDDEDDDRSLDPRRAPGDEDPGANLGGGRNLRAGVARKDLKVFDEPDPNGTPVGEIKAGERVTIMKESGDWALAVQSGANGVVMGWARRSEIAVR